MKKLNYEFLEKYKELGGYLVTLGSDAHVTHKAAVAFEEALALLKECGFRNIFYYENRIAIQCTVS